MSVPSDVRILDDTVVNQIAAGEVVERPASVVKELVENAIDAGADEVTVSLTRGGRSSIEVIDNGCGMGRDDALLAIERFGTSKIRSIEDLQRVGTLGFRGEALPSIASVSRFELSSRRADTQTGVQLRVSGGKLRDVAEADLVPGTRIKVANLFFNIPARKKFLRAEGTETGLVRSLLSDFAAAYPAVRFQLIVDGKESLSFPPVREFSERVRQLSFARKGQLVIDSGGEVGRKPFRVQGVLSQPIDSVSGSSRLRLLVNRRSVRDKLLLGAVRDGYGSYLKTGSYPRGVLSIELPAEDVDVNVHPQKSEVRFREPNAVFAAVSGAVRKALQAYVPEKLGDVSQPIVFEQRKNATSSRHLDSVGYERAATEVSFFDSSSTTPQETPVSKVVAPPQQDSMGSQNQNEETSRTVEKLSAMRYIGQIFKLYLLFEGTDRFAIVDMHAAHERVTFFRLKTEFLEGRVISQLLLVPETVSIPDDRIAHLETLLKTFGKLGFECERFGEQAIVFRAVPALLVGSSPRSLVEDCMSLAGWGAWETLLQERLDEVLARLACHGSIRSGREMEPEEAYALMQSLETAEAAAFCPHGRPVVTYLDEVELERLFGRI